MATSREHQKRLTREYKRQPKRIGAYCIRNIENQKCFVGVSRDVDARLNRHRFALRTNSEEVSAELQEDWNRLGADAFEFAVLETIEPPKGHEGDYDPTEDLLVLEQLLLEQLDPYPPRGYNRPPNRLQVASVDPAGTV